MKSAVLEFQRNRVEQQPSDAASVEILETIAELRSALQGIGRAIYAVERLAIAQLGGDEWKPSNKIKPSRSKGKGRVVSLPYSAKTTS